MNGPKTSQLHPTIQWRAGLRKAAMKVWKWCRVLPVEISKFDSETFKTLHRRKDWILPPSLSFFKLEHWGRTYQETQFSSNNVFTAAYVVQICGETRRFYLRPESLWWWRRETARLDWTAKLAEKLASWCWRTVEWTNKRLQAEEMPCKMPYKKWWMSSLSVTDLDAIS